MDRGDVLANWLASHSRIRPRAESSSHVAVESGTLLLTVNGTPLHARAGDSIYYDGDCMHAFENPRVDATCVYYLAMDVSGDSAGTEDRVATFDCDTR